VVSAPLFTKFLHDIAASSTLLVAIFKILTKAWYNISIKTKVKIFTGSQSQVVCFTYTPITPNSFSPLGKPADQARPIYFTFHNFFLSFFFFNDFSENNYLRIRWTDFRNLSPNESVLAADERSGLFFRYLKGRCHGNQFCEKMANSALSLLWHSETELDNAVCLHGLIAPLKPLYRVKFWWRLVQ